MLRAVLVATGLAVFAAPAQAQLPAVTVDATTFALPNFGAHRGVTVTAGCAAGSTLVGGGGYLRNATNPATLPTNGLVLGGTLASTGAGPVDAAPADGATDLSHWTTIANFTGQSEAGDQAATFALCATGGPAHTVVATKSTTGINATQEVNPPTITTATCPASTRLIGGGAMTRTPDQINDGVTAGNNGNLKPLANYPSDAAGVAAADGSTTATSWSAYGSAGGTAATDEVTAFALCSADAPVVRVARVDVAGPDAQPGTTTLSSPVSCPAGTRLFGGGYKVDESVGATDGLQPQQGYHMRGSYPLDGAAEAADGATNLDTWTALVQAGGQNLAAGRHMNLRGFALCAQAPVVLPDLGLTLTAAPSPAVVAQPLTYTLTVKNTGGDATGVSLADTLPAGLTLVSADDCTHAGGTVTCAVGALAAGASATRTIVVTPTVAGDVVNTAEATLTETDVTPADNTASSTATVLAAPRAKPALAPTSPRGGAGEPISSGVALTSGAAPTGTITFSLYGPRDQQCLNPLATSTVSVNGNGTYSSAPYVATEPGQYRWGARYSGDGGNEPAALACDSATLSVKLVPALALTATAGGATATLSDGSALTGEVEFGVFDDAGCATPLATYRVTVAGNGSYGSPAFAAPGPGTYRWTARYSGNDANVAVGPTPCGGAVVELASTPIAFPAPPVASNAFTVRSAKASGAGVLTLKLEAPGAGRFVAAAKAGGATFGRVTVTKRAKGALTLTIKPTAKAKRALRRHTRVKVTVSITFTPQGGAPATKKTTVTIKRS